MFLADNDAYIAILVVRSLDLYAISSVVLLDLTPSFFAAGVASLCILTSSNVLSRKTKNWFPLVLMPLFILVGMALFPPIEGLISIGIGAGASLFWGFRYDKEKCLPEGEREPFRKETYGRVTGILMLTVLAILTTMPFDSDPSDWLPSEEVAVKGESARKVYVLSSEDHHISVFYARTGDVRLIAQDDIERRSLCRDDLVESGFLYLFDRGTSHSSAYTPRCPTG